MNFLKARLRGLCNYKHLLSQLVVRDIKLKYRRSFLGYFWSILNPLLIMVVMVIVFSNIFRYKIPHFPVYLLAGQTLFLFMTESTTFAISSITGNAALIKKIYVPKYIFTFSKVTSSLVNLLFSLVALFIVLLVTKTPITPYLLLFPITLIEIYIFCIGLGMFLAQAAVFFRDIQYIYGVLTSAWMYLTPIFYPIEIIPEQARGFIMYGNPMYYYITQFRSFVLYGKMPEPYLIWGGLAIALIFLLFGSWIFLRTQDKFILYI